MLRRSPSHLAARALARWVLMWFALSLGAAIASPMVQPHAMELVCSSAGAVKLVVKSDGGAGQKVVAHTLECPLCMALNTPPAPQPAGVAEPAPSLSHVLRNRLGTQVAARTAAPPPARGPPIFLL